MNVVFMGTPEFSVPVLKKLMEHHSVIAVVTQPDRPVGRKRVLTPSPVKVEAQKHDIKVIQPEKIRQNYEEIVSLNPDIIVTAAYGQIVPRALLDAPKYGCINVHASLLPKYRGGAPIHQAIIDGEKETGISIMYMEEKLDAGDVLAQQATPIEADDDVGTMHHKLSIIGADLLMTTIKEIRSGQAKAVPQENDQVTFAPNIRREQEELSWEKPAQQLANQVRGMRPWPGAFTWFEGKRLKVWAATATTETTSAKPGTVVRSNKEGIFVATGDGTILCLTNVQLAGKKAMDASQLTQQFSQSIQLGVQHDEG
ncbi:methionyl-tRNA formyltransferase [Shouchella sp. 1P09AA]